MTNTTNAETPRVDEFSASPRGLGTGYYQALNLARSLERERNALKSENERLREVLAEYKLRYAVEKDQLEKWKAVVDRLAQQISRTGNASWNTDAEQRALNAFEDLLKSDQLKKESES